MAKSLRTSPASRQAVTQSRRSLRDRQALMQLDASMLFAHDSFQIAWCALALALAKSCLGRAAPRACQGGSGIIGKAAQHPSPLLACWHLYMMSLQNMLDAAAPDQILARGQGWSSIVSGDASKGSRLAQVVARLCRCGITTVMQAMRHDGPRENHVNNWLSGHIHQRDMRMVVPSAERSAERSMTLYGQTSNKGWSRHQCSPFRR